MSVESQLKPSSKDVMQFINPNPKAVSVGKYILSTQSITSHDISSWNEDKSIIVFDDKSDWQDLSHQMNAEFELPLFYQSKDLNQDQLLELRKKEIDGVILPLEWFFSSQSADIMVLAQSIHMRLIPLVNGDPTREDEFLMLQKNRLCMLGTDYNGSIDIIKKYAYVISRNHKDKNDVKIFLEDVI